jgi:hypothetical protein
VRRRWRWLAAAAALLLAVGGTVMAVDYFRPPPEASTPPDPVAEAARRIKQRLAEREKVVLLGPTGLPTWQRWHTGPIRLDHGDEQEPLEFESMTEAYLELFDELPPKIDRYRFTVELRQVSNLTPTGADARSSRGTVGVFFNWQALTAGSARFGQCHFRDVATLREHVDGAFRKVTIFCEDVLKFPEGKQPYQSRNWATAAVPAGADQRAWQTPWRQLVVEVTPDALKLYFGAPAEEPQLLATRTAKVEAANRKRHQQLWDARHPGSGLALPPLSPRGGLGLYVNCARAQFRNATVTPLPPP